MEGSESQWPAILLQRSKAMWLPVPKQNPSGTAAVRSTACSPSLLLKSHYSGRISTRDFSASPSPAVVVQFAGAPLGACPDRERRKPFRIQARRSQTAAQKSNLRHYQFIRPHATATAPAVGLTPTSQYKTWL